MVFNFDDENCAGTQIYKEYLENYLKDCNEIWLKYQDDLYALTKGFVLKVMKIIFLYHFIHYLFTILNVYLCILSYSFTR